MKWIKKSIGWLLLLALVGVLAGGLYWFLYLRPRPPVVIVGPGETEFQEAREYRLAHPEEYDAAITRFNNIIAKYPKSRFATFSKRQVELIEEAKAVAVEAAWTDLRDRASDMADQEELEQALYILRSYQGPFAAELTERRKEMMRDIARRLLEIRQAGEKALAEAQNQLAEFMQQVAAAIYKMDFSAASTLISRARSDVRLRPVQNELEAFLSETDVICAMPEQLCMSFLENMGEVVTVELNRGTFPVRVTDVQGTRVIAERVLYNDAKTEIGTTPSSFVFSDMTPKERAKRIGRIKSDANLTMMSLLLLQARQQDRAYQYLSEVQTVLAQLLMEQIEQERAEREARRPVPFEPVFEPDANNKLIVL